MAIITKPRGQQKERNLQPPMFPHYFLIMAILWKHLVTPGWPQLCKVPSGHIMNVHLCWQSERQETADGWDNREAKVGSSVIALLFRKRMCLTRTKKKKKAVPGQRKDPPCSGCWLWQDWKNTGNSYSMWPPNSPIFQRLQVTSARGRYGCHVLATSNTFIFYEPVPPTLEPT